ncbi:MAG: hypothetical protein IJE89_00615 [Bacilli bacterium]|nr:hypothetical protein [Bacilli bacterium]
MDFKKLIIILSVTVSIMFGVLLGISYGWYAYSNAESNINASTLKTAPTIVFAQTEYIESTQNMPIYDSDRYKYANKNSFTVTLGENLIEYETGLEILLNDINISNELKIENYKYELLQNKKIISSGNFSNLGDIKTIKLLPMTIMKPENYPYTYVYELYIWLSEDETDQNSLMNKTFGAKIDVNSATKK